MVLYLYGKGIPGQNIDWYAGRDAAGKVKWTPYPEHATFFTEDEKETAEDCVNLGCRLYSMVCEWPRLVQKVPRRSGSQNLKKLNLS